MIAIAENKVAQDATELAVRLAKSRVGLAALKRKHSDEAIDDEDISHASVLRDYYKQSLQARERVPLDEDVVPRAEVRQILQTVLSTYECAPRQIVDEENVRLLVGYLERFVSSNLTADDATELIALLNRLNRPMPAPLYNPDTLETANHSK